MPKKDKDKSELAPDISKANVRKLVNNNFGSFDHRGRGVPKGQKRAQRDEYLRRKAQVFEVEQKNHKLLIMFRASSTGKNAESQFYVMGGNSALIYASDIGKELGRTVKLHDDNDIDEYKFKNGVAFVRNIKKLMAELEKLGLKQQKLSAQWKDDEIICFKLKREYTDAEIRGILEERKAELERCNNMIYPKKVYPETHKYIISFYDYTIPKVLRLNERCFATLGRDIYNFTMRMVELYSMMSRGDFSIDEGRSELLIVIDKLLARIKVMMDLNKWELSSCAQMGELLYKLRRSIKASITREENERKEKKKNASGS